MLALRSSCTLTDDYQVRLDRVRDQAFSAIRSSLNGENILQELSSSLTSKLVIALSMVQHGANQLTCVRYPAILEMQVEVLLQHIASIHVIQNMASLVRRIADSQLPHGADIIIHLYQKVLLQYHPALALASVPTDSDEKQPQSSGRFCDTPLPPISPQPWGKGPGMPMSKPRGNMG